jgi:hypothetical protein
VDKLREKYKQDIERQSTVRVQKTGKLQITGSSEKLSGDALKAWLDERMDGCGEDGEYDEYQDDIF